MKPRRILSVARLSFPLATALAALFNLASPTAFAADGTWTGAAGTGIWGGTGNWVSSAVASGTDFTALFTSEYTVTQNVAVNTARTIGNITFTDTTSSNDVNINVHTTAFDLTLAVTTGSPTINVTQSDRTLTINNRLAGSDGMTKAGVGRLILSGTNTFTGGVNISAGVLQFGSTGALNGTAGSQNSVAFGSGSTGTLALAGNSVTIANLSTNATPGTTFVQNANGAAVGNVTLTVGNSTNPSGTYAGTIQNGTGGGTLALTKAGTGTLALSGTNTYTGGTTVSAGSLVFLNTNAKAASGTHAFAAGTTLGLGVAAAGSFFTATDITNAFAGTMTGNLSNVTVTGTTNVGIDTTAGDFTYATSVAGSPTRGLTKSGINTLTLTGTNTYTGNTLVSAGTLQLSKQVSLYNNGAAAAWSKTNINVNSGATMAFNIGGAGEFTKANIITLLGLADATTNGFKTGSSLGLDTTSGDFLYDSIIANPNSGANVLGLIKLGTNTLTLSALSATAASNYTGTTTLGGGTLALTTTSPSLSGGLTFGAVAASTSTGTLDLTGIASAATFSNLMVQTNSATANTITVGSGKTLTFTGTVIDVGLNNPVGSTTKLTIGGATSGVGSLVVNNSAAVVRVGVEPAVDSTAAASTLDLTTIGNVSLGTIVAPITTVSVGGRTTSGTLLLSNTANVITATNLILGDSNGNNAGGTNLITLGTGTNVINAGTINIGYSKATATLGFASQTAGSPGTVTIVNKAGGNATAALNLGSQDGTNTGTSLTGNLDLRGHVATVNVGVVNIGRTNGTGAGNAVGILRFDAGTFDATSLNLGIKSNTGTSSNVNNAVNIGGGTFTVSGAVAMSAHTGTGATGNVTSKLNITNGTVNLGSTVSVANKNSATSAGTAAGEINVSGGALNVTGLITLGTQATAGTATALLNITGGTVTSTAGIFGGAGTTTSTINLNGASAILDLTGDNITDADTITYTNGTLKNLGVVNTGMTLAGTGSRVFDQDVSILGTIQGNITGTSIGLTKSGLGTLTLSGTNGFSGATLVSGGTLALSGTGAVNSSSGITVSGSGAKFLQTSSVAVSPTVTLTQGTLTGSGTVNTVNVGAGTGGIISNNDGVAGASLTIGALTFNGSATVNTFSNSTSAPIVTTTLASTAGTVTINANNVLWTVGTPYDLISHMGSIGGAGFTGRFAIGTVSNTTSRQTKTLLDSGTAVTLTIGADDVPVWSGAGSTTWTTATSGDNTGPNAWALKNGQTATNFWLGDNVEFNDTYNLGSGDVAVTNTTATITAGVAPLSTTFNNSTVDYTLGSSDSTGITSGSLIKNGTGSLTIGTANTYTGATAINAGTITLSGAGTLGTGSALTLGGGKLDLGTLSRTVGAVSVTAPAASGDTILNGSLTGTSYAVSNTTGNATISAGLLASGGAGVTKTGAGTVTLSGTNTYTGATAINAGNVTLSGSGTLGSGSAVTLGGGQLDLGGLSRTVGAVSVTAPAASGDTISNGSLTGTSYAASNTSGTAVISANLLVNSTAGFTKSGAGTTTLSGTNTYTGATTVSAGTLTLAAAGSITTAGNILLNVSGATAVANIAGSYTSTGGGGVAVNSGGILNTSGTIAISGANNQAIFLGTSGGSGTWNVTGGSVSVNYTSNGWGIGNTGAGTLNVSAGSVTTAATNVFNVGHGAGGTGSLTISGSGLVTVNAGTGLFNIGFNATSTGTVNLNAAPWPWGGTSRKMHLPRPPSTSMAACSRLGFPVLPTFLRWP